MKKLTAICAAALQFAIVLLLLSCSKNDAMMNVSNDPMAAATGDSGLTYLALGDSYTIGQSVNEMERFPVQTVSLLTEQGLIFKDPTIIATTGWTTRNLLDALNAVKLPGNFDLVTLLIGVNDQYQGKSLGEYKTEFTLLLDHAIQFAGGRPSHVIVVSIPDYSVTPFAGGSDRPRIAAEIDQFNAANKQITLQRGVNYVDITPISRETDPALTAGDGLHPSGKQYRRWAELLWPLVKKMNE